MEGINIITQMISEVQSPDLKRILEVANEGGYDSMEEFEERVNELIDEFEPFDDYREAMMWLMENDPSLEDSQLVFDNEYNGIDTPTSTDLANALMKSYIKEEFQSIIDED